jgi:hypothetical protein
MEKVTASQLKLGDVIQVFEGPYGTATVKKIESEKLTLFRPYALTQDWSYTGGVICTLGIEEYSIFITNSKMEYVLWRRGNVDRQYQTGEAAT